VASAKARCGGELTGFLVVTSRRIGCLTGTRNPVEICLELLTQE
jgi:hypothetical protein